MMEHKVDNDEENINKIIINSIIIGFFYLDILNNSLQVAKFSLYDREMCKTIYLKSRPIPDGLNNSHICVKDKTEETAHCMVSY